MRFTELNDHLQFTCPRRFKLEEDVSKVDFLTAKRSKVNVLKKKNKHATSTSTSSSLKKEQDVSEAGNIDSNQNEEAQEIPEDEVEQIKLLQSKLQASKKSIRDSMELLVKDYK